jgi:hypothetical protein
MIQPWGKTIITVECDDTGRGLKEKRAHKIRAHKIRASELPNTTNLAWEYERPISAENGS